MANKNKVWKYKCAVNGMFKMGARIGICGHVSLGDSGYCTAHGNHKCIYKQLISVKEVN